MDLQRRIAFNVSIGLPKLKIEECAARQQARIDSGRQVIVGVNKYAPDTTAAGASGHAEDLAVRHIDNTMVLAAQKERLDSVRRNRDPARVAAVLSAIEEAARAEPGAAQNLLGLCVEAARARATVGEITFAMEKVWGRYEAASQMSTGVYGAEVGGAIEAEVAAVRAAVERFEAAEGRRPRILVAKMGMDGHDRGAKVMATGWVAPLACIAPLVAIHASISGCIFF